MAAPLSQHQGAAPAPARQEKVNILLVDDQQARLIAYEAILRELGQNLVSAQSGAEALRLLMDREFAVILLDVNMPIMDGFETAALIHQHPRYERTPIIFVTAVNISDLDRLRGYKLGAIDYVYVPVVPEILRSKVSVLVELYQQRRELMRLNRSLEEAYAELEHEKARKLGELNATLERANSDLARSNIALQGEIAERSRGEDTIRVLNNALQRRVEELETIIELSPVGIAIAEDAECRAMRINRALREMLGVSEGQSGAPIPGSDAAPTYTVERNGQPIPPENLPLQYCAREAIEIDGLEFDVIRPDGARFAVVASARPLFDDAGKVRGAINVAVDITERKNMEQRLREADRRKDEFLALLGHELRNPLAPLRNALHLMKRLHLSEPGLGDLRDVIARQVDHLTRLVDDLLDVARITRGKIELRRELHALTEIVERALETSRPLIDARRHQLALHVAREPIPIDGDPARLGQVISNLLNNAAKYTPEAGRIELRARRDGDFAEISVRDDGTGIPPHMLREIFEPFRQVQETRDQSLGGLGIGLALVARLVDMHGGTVAALSDGLGCGSEFVVRLPIAAMNVRTAPAAQAAAPAGSVCRRVLVADDNLDAANTLALMLRLEGHEVAIAKDGREAVEIAGSFRPDIALLDIGMPHVDGYEAARRIRAQPWGRAITLIALTGWGQPDDRQRTLEAGFAQHRVKPVDTDDILRLVAETGTAAHG